MAKIGLMIDFKNKIYEGSEDRESLYDVKIPDKAKAVVIFIHGYKGYKDWGAWHLLEKEMVNAEFGFVKFNMTHNGGTVESRIDFPDLEAFANNCYSFELTDLKVIVDEIDRLIHQELELDIPIYLMGHSRGGGIAILYAAKDDRIKKVISLAGISDIENRFPKGDAFKDWRRNGVFYVENGRTKQQMPHYYTFYEDFEECRDDLNIEKAARSLKIPFLQIHGDMDQSVSISEGQNLASWTDTELEIIKGAGHTFETKQPWESDELPFEMKKVVEKSVDFLNQ